jgi:hypothetical protein
VGSQIVTGVIENYFCMGKITVLPNNITALPITVVMRSTKPFNVFDGSNALILSSDPTQDIDYIVTCPGFRDEY